MQSPRGNEGYYRTQTFLAKTEGKRRDVPVILQNFKGIAFKLDRNFAPLFMEGGAVEEITGYTEKDLISGRINFFNLLDPEDFSLLDNCRNKMSSVPPNSIMEYDYRFRRKDGTVRWSMS